MSDRQFGAWLTTRWVGLYTRGLGRDVRTDRADEIASDVWEHLHDGRTLGISDWATNAAVTQRLLLGIPADLSWRRSQGNVHRVTSTAGVTMSPHRLWPFTRVLVVLQGIALVVIGFAVFFGIVTDDANPDWNATSGLGFALMGLAALAGLVVRRRFGAVGVGMICIASLLSVGMVWYSLVFLIGLVTFVLTLVTAPWDRAARRVWSASDALSARTGNP